ncbi:MAG: hypothetical protein IJ899_18695 [Blautia sp.]|nr:hypothetical protein [Blautia sp.]
MTELDDGDLSESDLSNMKPAVLPVLRLRHMGLSDQDIVPYNNNFRLSGVSSSGGAFSFQSLPGWKMAFSIQRMPENISINDSGEERRKP